METGSDCFQSQVFGPSGCVPYTEQLSVGDRHPSGGNCDEHFGGGAVVGIIVDWNIVPGIFGLALRPDFFGLIRITLVGKNEIKALFGPALVANEDLVCFAGLEAAASCTIRLLGVTENFGVVAIEGYRVDIQSDRVELDL